MKNGHIMAPMGMVQDIKNRLNEVSTSFKDVDILLPLKDWVLDESDYTYSQTITVEGVTDEFNPIIMLKPADGEEPTGEEYYSYACITKVITAKDSITFVADGMPTADLAVIAKNVTAPGSTNTGNGNNTAIDAELRTRVDELETEVDNLTDKVAEVETSLKDAIIPLLLDNWVADGDNYTYTATVEGVTSEYVPLITLTSAGDTATEDELNAYYCITDVVTSDGTIKFIASEKPNMSFTVTAKNATTAESNVTDVTALVTKINELETEVSTLKDDLKWKRIDLASINKHIMTGNTSLLYSVDLTDVIPSDVEELCFVDINNRCTLSFYNTFGGKHYDSFAFIFPESDSASSYNIFVYGIFDFDTKTFSANQTMRGKDAVQCNFTALLYK
jgi:hypothetical protein